MSPSPGRVGLPPQIIGSTGYNDSPTRLEIDGVRASHPLLFRKVAELGGARERAAYFHGYMDATFGAAPSRGFSRGNGYLRYLLGWMTDSNSPEGAVLKGWAEERFGLPPTYHREPLPKRECEAFRAYERDRARCPGSGETLLEQLDLLYEFIQEELRITLPGVTHLTLFRGTNGLSGHTRGGEPGGTRLTLRLNNLNSFTRDFERAWEFGDRVIEARVPLTKIFFDEVALPTGVLKGEEEIIVIGGNFDVRLRWS